jgi:two-component system chemotaxis response regulator CheY
MRSSIKGPKRITPEIEKVTIVSQQRILVIDDSSLIRLYYRDVLGKAGFEVAQAINGIEAMEKVLAQPFDLVIVDVNMPRMDGLSFLRALRRSPSGAATFPALVITTEAGEQDVDDARTAGANFYLVKPVLEDDLLRHVAVLAGPPK